MGIFKRLMKFKQQKMGQKIENRTLLNVRVGDRITYELEDYEVVGKIIFNDHGFQWFEYQLENVDRTLCLSVKMADELEVRVYHKLKKKIVEPIPNCIEWEDEDYFLDEKGAANVSGQGRHNRLSGQTIRYFAYSNENKSSYLSVEIWEIDIEVNKGIPAQALDFTIIAGS
ncbi:hypothetical protein GCM10011391_33660 [Pullulanibacillus camelliae]|uniref:DUF4178 domain-containing protein n=1 Tax=Pullulanibacillus camelliae TaxID=1707096 RepID=A0A8J3DZR6_9BACL|nr:DUF4178 domain-containing protein [Pullulanibacillus camelliae]GGE52108.1 hypothetical protein GCM10011391_33660 [Pullulanibacillus camelliae]